MNGIATNRIAVGALAALLAAAAMPALGQEGVSPWSDGLHARARLIAASPAPDGHWRAGVEISLDPGFKTYWRSPGSSGVPPRFDFSGSQNLKAITVRYPAPVGFADGVGTSIGYTQGVVLPLAVTPANPAQPVTLALKLSYAICDKLCIPVQAEARLEMTGSATPTPNDARLADFERQVPLERPLGASGAPAVVALQPDGSETFTVTARLPTGGDAALFAEGGPGWYYETGAPSRAGDTARFVLRLLEKPEDKAVKDGFVTLTLATDSGAVETHVALDATRQKP
jgi:DsbC/DsbD-like thiol-disulfide interchange protein